jgi:hypothetical protein
MFNMRAQNLLGNVVVHTLVGEKKDRLTATHVGGCDGDLRGGLADVGRRQDQCGVARQQRGFTLAHGQQELVHDGDAEGAGSLHLQVAAFQM